MDEYAAPMKEQAERDLLKKAAQLGYDLTPLTHAGPDVDAEPLEKPREGKGAVSEKRKPDQQSPIGSSVRGEEFSRNRNAFPVRLYVLFHSRNAVARIPLGSRGGGLSVW